MAESIESQIEKLRLLIKGLEVQRAMLGNEVVDPALAALKLQLSQMEGQVLVQAIPNEERRILTILFIDVVGSTSIAEKLDPEEWREIISRIHLTLSKVITEHNGNVVQYLGDGLLALFGSQQASEQDPANAVHAALDSHSSVINLPFPQKLQLRAGINTGLVVVGELGDISHKEFTASGDAMNLAARLQSIAPPGGTIISNTTYPYVKGLFVMSPQTPITVKGKSEPLQTYLVLRASPHPFLSAARGVAGIETRTIGRDVETRILKEAYIKAYQGYGVVWAQLVGEPGIGKSRLLNDLNDWIGSREESVSILHARCFPADVNKPFALIRRLWFDHFQLAEDVPLMQTEHQWVKRFSELSGFNDYEEAAHALGLMVGLTFENSPFIKGLRNDPDQVKGRALVVSRDLLKAERQSYPIVILLEDLHWIDQASWEYLIEVLLHEANAIQPNGLFILGTSRFEWNPPQQLTRLFTSSISPADETSGILITLSALSDQSIRILSEEIFRHVLNVPENVLQLLVERSEGVPYYTEEMINWFIDRGIIDTQTDPWRFSNDKFKEKPVPSTLQHLLFSRLSLLSQAEKTTLQYGAIFGRHFWTGGIEALGIFKCNEILSHLHPQGFVDVQPESLFQDEIEWSFHHHLLQEVTYETILKRERPNLHRGAAEWLKKQANQAGRLDEYAGILAEHYHKAGELREAADWFIKAGKYSFNHGAPQIARDFYTQALNLLPSNDCERRWNALLGREETLNVIGEADAWKKDISALLELASTNKDENYLATVYLLQALFGIRTGDMSISKYSSQKALEVSRRCANEAIEVKALILKAKTIIDQGESTGVERMVRKAVNHARSLNDDSVLAFVLHRAAYCYLSLNDYKNFYTLQLEQIDLDKHLGNRNQVAIGLNNLGVCYLNLGLYEMAFNYLEQAKVIEETLNAHRVTAYTLTNQSEINMVQGDVRKAEELAKLSLKEIALTTDTRGKSIALNNLGYILLQEGDVNNAVMQFNEAYELASGQEMAPLKCQSLAGLSACEVKQGQFPKARKNVTQAWNLLRALGWVGMVQPALVYRLCAEVYSALDEDDNVQIILNAGHKAILEVANNINVLEWRQSFLESEINNHALLEMWQRYNKD